jgi:hypothetical protein
MAMRRLIAGFSVLVIFALPVFAATEPPRIIPHSAQVPRPLDDVFGTLKRYFSDSSLSQFTLISADKTTRTLIAKQTGIPPNKWREWSSCEVDPVHIIYQLTDSSVTVTVHLEKGEPHTTFATITADFEGTYGLGSNVETIGCRSTGTLEDSLLAVAGATPPSQ